MNQIVEPNDTWIAKKIGSSRDNMRWIIYDGEDQVATVPENWDADAMRVVVRAFRAGVSTGRLHGMELARRKMRQCLGLKEDE